MSVSYVIKMKTYWIKLYSPINNLKDKKVEMATGS